MQSDSVTVETAVPSRSPAAAPGNDGPERSAFECNICYDVAESPVVTLCGHLYCWPCLYRWAPREILSNPNALLAQTNPILTL